VIEDGVDDAGAVEAGHDGQPPRDGGRLEPALFLQPAHVQFDVDPARFERVDLACGAPAQKHM
jgi:hypothetical protein